MINANKLQRAAQLIDEAIEEANLDAFVCEHCDAHRYEDYQEAKAHKELQGMSNKIIRFALQFRT